MDDGECAHHPTDLIALEPPDEMPAQGQISQRLLLRACLLKAAFAKVQLTKPRQRPNRLRWMNEVCGGCMPTAAAARTS